MKKFADFGLNVLGDKHIFQVPVISIDEIANMEIEVLDYEKGIKTAHGDNRYIVKIKSVGIEFKFFTNAAPIKKALDLIPKEEFPFTTIIKQQRFGSGSGKTFYFT